MVTEKQEAPVKLELSLIASHEKKEKIEEFCKAMNMKPKWIKEKKQGQYYTARLWFKRRLPADLLGSL